MTNISISEVRLLSEILAAVDGHVTIVWKVKDTDHELRGTVRAITTEGGAFLHGKDNIQDGYLWVSATFEHFLPIPEVIEMIDAGRLFGIAVGV